jgi:MraZ protein
VFFTGINEHTIDAKHRLAIPAPVRNQLTSSNASEALYIHLGHNNALWLWPAPTFERMAGEVEPSMTPDLDVHEFDESMFPSAHLAEFDSAGRITIPEFMLAEAGLGAKVVILGMRHHLEVRDPQQWSERQKQQAPRRGEIAQRAGAILKKDKLRRTKSGGDE